MSLTEYIAQLKGRRATLESTFELTVAGVGNDLLQMVQDRIQSRGVAANGSAFKDYTEEYKNRKSKAGKFTGVVDYTLTSRMWSDTQQRIKNVSKSGNVYRLVIGPASEINQKKFESLEKRDGQIPTKPSTEEIAIAKENLLTNINLQLFG